MAKKKVFVSFDYDHDKNYKLLLQAWDSNPNFEFNFNDKSVTVPIDSKEESRIKAGITSKMNDSTYFLVIIGEHTHKSKWISWEIENANKAGLKLVAVKIDKSFKKPDALSGKDVSWSMNFKQDSIISAMENSDRNNNTRILKSSLKYREKPLKFKKKRQTLTINRKRRTNTKNYSVNVSESTFCRRCHRRLTNPTSIRLGVGPYCRTKV